MPSFRAVYACNLDNNLCVVTNCSLLRTCGMVLTIQLGVPLYLALLIKIVFSWPCSPKLMVKVVDEDSKPAAGGLKPPTKDEADSSDMVCISQSILARAQLQTLPKRRKGHAMLRKQNS